MAAATAIATILFGGVVSGVLTFALNTRRDERTFTRAKLETLFVAARRFGANLEAHYFHYFALVKRELDLNSVLDLQRQNSPGTQDVEQIDLLIAIYFPEVDRAYRQLLEVRDALTTLATDSSVK